MRFSDVPHQERAISILRRALRSGRTHHAYLLEGPEGVGKEAAGRALAARLLCEDDSLEPDADACGACTACRLLASGNHPDLHVIERRLHKLHPDRTIRASKGLFLVVDLVRHFLIEPAGMKPAMGRRRVFLIREAERMNEEAQNALLKTLEEPPGSGCLILVTASAERLLPTIRSRCQRISFDLLPAEHVVAELQRRAGLSAEDAQALAALAGGRLGVARRWHELGLLAHVDAVAQCVQGLAEGDPEAFGKTMVEIATELAAESVRLDDETEMGGEPGGGKGGGKSSVPTDALRDALKLVFMVVASLYRDALLVQVDVARLRALPRQSVPLLVASVIGREQGPLLKSGGTGNRRDTEAIDYVNGCIHAINDAERMLDRNVAPQLVCEQLAVALLGETPAA